MPQTEKSIKANNEANINSYNTHRFQIRFENGTPNSQFVTFTKGPYEEVITVFNEDNILSFEQVSKYDEFQDTVIDASARYVDSPSATTLLRPCADAKVYLVNDTPSV